MTELEEAGKDALTLFDRELDGAQWVEWIHEGSTPAKNDAEKLFNLTVAAISGHCAKCLNLGGCRFASDKMPKIPLHENCHCETRNIARPLSGITAFAICPISKPTKYAFTNSAKKFF